MSHDSHNTRREGDGPEAFAFFGEHLRTRIESIHRRVANELRRIEPDLPPLIDPERRKLRLDVVLAAVADHHNTLRGFMAAVNANTAILRALVRVVEARGLAGELTAALEDAGDELVRVLKAQADAAEAERRAARKAADEAIVVTDTMPRDPNAKH